MQTMFLDFVCSDPYPEMLNTRGGVEQFSLCVCVCLSLAVPKEGSEKGDLKEHSLRLLSDSKVTFRDLLVSPFQDPPLGDGKCQHEGAGSTIP